MKKQIYKTTSSLVVAFVMALVVVAPLHANAQEGTVEAYGLYAHPYTGIIEDSGGESSSALGQSMVDNMVGQEAYLENDESGQLYVTFTFSLMNSISEVGFVTQDKDETKWNEVEYQVVSEGDDITTFRIPLEATSSVVRATCFVEPMGRSVVFYIVFNQSGVAQVVSVTNDPSEALDGTTGLIVANDTDAIEEEEVEEAIVINDGENLVLGNGFWMHAFMLLVSVNVLTVLLIMVLYFSLKNIFKEREERNAKAFQVIDDTYEEEVEADLTDLAELMDDGEWDEE